MFDTPQETPHPHTNSNPKIYLEFCGGLGNRMWQLAAAIAAAIRYNAVIYVNKTAITNHQNQTVNYFETIFQNIGIDHPTQIPQLPYHTYYIPFMISTEKYTMDDLHFPIHFNQYYQYYPVIEPYENQIRTIYLTNLETQRAQILQKHPNIYKCAFMHIRRGDYLQFPRHPVQPIEYYQSCMTDLDTKLKYDAKVFVFSDDIEWVKNQPFFNPPQTTSPNQTTTPFEIIETDEIETMAYMSLCRGGAICANSSFSWWGAFLGAHQTRSPVYVPRNWMLECQIDGLFPDEWNQI